MKLLVRRTFATAVALAAFAAAAASAAPLDPAVAEIVGKPAEGKALVVFFRPAKFSGAAVGFKVRESEHELGKLRNGNYFTVEAAPGAHAYTVHSEAKDLLNLEVEAGETYFVSGAVGMGFIVGRPNITPSTVADFEKVMKKLKKSKPLDNDDDKDEAKAEK
jgi:hypothetical protein